MPKSDLQKRINRGLAGGTTLVGGGGGAGIGGSVGNAHTVDFLHASVTPEPGKLFPLDGTSKFLDSVLPSTIVRSSRQVISGAGLTGGGDLSADRTLAVGAGTLITVNANDVALSVGSAQYQVPVTGADPFTPGWTLLSSLAGAGLAWGSGVFDVGAGDGIAVAANAVAVALSTAAGLQLAGTPKTLEMGTPSTVTASSTNTVSAATHSHAVTATADGAASHSTLLKSGASGELQLDYADLLTDLTVPEINAAAALTLKPATDLILDPTSNLVKLTSTVSIQADNFASQTTGWRATYEGAGDFRYLFADEMHVKSFIADLEQALAGGQIICKSVSTVAVAYTLPAAGGASTVWIKDLPSAENMAVFVSGDLIRFRQFSRAAGELTVADAWGIVTSYTDQADKMQTWTFTRSAGGLAGTASGVIPIDAIVLDYGVTGNGYYEVNAIDGLYADNSPYAQIVTWATHPLTTLATKVRLGNLHGIYSVDNEYGLHVSRSAFQYLRLSSSAFEVHGLDIKLYNSIDVNTIRINPVLPAIQIGYPTLPLGDLGGGDGIYMGLGSSGYEFRAGTVSGGVLVKGMHWDGASLDIRGNLIVGPGHGFVLESPSMVCAYDGPRPYATDYQVDLSGHLGQKGTPVGAVIGRPGVFGKALQTGGAATNLAYNPVFGGTYGSGLAPSVTEDDAGGTITPTENTDMAYIEYGTKSQKLVFTGSANCYIRLEHGTMTNSTTYTWYLRFYLAAGSFRVMSNIGNTSYYEDFSTLGWNTYCYTGATAGSGPSFEFYLYSAAGATVYLTRSQITTLAYNTPLISGDLPGHTWAGTAYASTSARVASYVTYPIGDVIKNARKGSIGMWVYCEGTNPDSSVLACAGNAVTELAIWMSPAGNLLGWVNDVPISRALGPNRAWHHAVLTWDCATNEMYVYADGAPSSVGNPSTTPPTLHATTFSVGYSPLYGATCIHPGYLCDFFVTEQVLTADQVRQIYQSALPIVATRNPMSLLLTGTGRGKVEGSAGGIFGLDSAGKPTWTLLNEATTVNGEALGIGDVLLGDNTASKANLLWDQSAGKLLFRGGVTMQVEIGTDGKLAAGAGVVTLGTTGVKVLSTTSWLDIRGYQLASAAGTTFGGLFTYESAAPVYWGSFKVGKPGISSSLEILAQCDSSHFTTQASLGANQIDADGVFVHGIAIIAEVFDATTRRIKVAYGDAAGADEMLGIDSGGYTQWSLDSDGNAFFNGNVGIGTASPVSPLNVKGSTSYGSIKISPASDDGEASMGFMRDAAGTDTNDAWAIGQNGWGTTGNTFVIGNENNGAGGNVRLAITKAGNVGIGDVAPGEKLDVTGNTNVTGVYKVDDVQVVSNRVIDARCDDAINSGDATTDGVIDSLRDAMIAHGLIAAA